MIQTKKKIIAKHEATVLQFAGTKSNQMFVRFTQSINLQTKSITADPESWNTFCFEFLEGTTLDGRELGRQNVFDDIFAGNISLLFEVILYVATVNFGEDFLSQGGSTGATQDSPITTRKK